MPIDSAITSMLGIKHPIFQAPMAGGGDTPKLVAAVSQAGGMGFIGCAYLSPDEIVARANAVKSITSQPFGVNLFAPTARMEISARDYERAVSSVKPFYDELDLEVPGFPLSSGPSFDEQVSAVMETGAAAFSFTFGVMPEQTMKSLRKSGMAILGTATTVEEALALEETGVDAVIAQAGEAGGHRGTFLGRSDASVIAGLALYPQMVDALHVPVVASGGIMDGRGIAAALLLGAAAVQLGTAFLTTPEAGVPEAYKDLIASSRSDRTTLTSAFSGRAARGLRNRFLEHFERPGHRDSILPFPYQNALTRPLRAHAAAAGLCDYLSLWAGQGAYMARQLPAEDLVRRLVEETDDLQR